MSSLTSTDNLIFEFHSVHGVLIRYCLHICAVLLTLDYLYVIYWLFFKICCLRSAVERIDQNKATRFAWTVHTRTSNVLEAKQSHFKKLKSMCKCIHNSARSIIHFYKYFMCFQLMLTVFLGRDYTLMAEWSVSSCSYVLYTILRLTEIQIIPIMLCSVVRAECKNNIVVLSKYCYKLEPNLLKKETKRCIRRFLYTSVELDCGYFEINFRLLAIIFDFVSLFVFTIIM